MYSRVCLLCIIVTISLGYVASKPGVEENKKIFSVSLDVINPRDWNCKFMSNQSQCEVDLSAVKESLSVPAVNNGLRLVMIIEIGAAKQPFRVVLDSGSDLLWVFSNECLDDKNDNCKGHAKFVLDKAPLYRPFKLGYSGGGRITGKEVTCVDVHVTDLIAVKAQLFGAADDTTLNFRYADGVMGLNMDTKHNQPSVIYNMIAQNLITEPAYSLCVKEAKTAMDGGDITFGGHNEALVEADSGVKVGIQLKEHYMTEMTSLKVGDVFYCSEDIHKCKILVDSGSASIYGPKEFVDDLLKEINADAHGIVDCKNIPEFPTIEIMFGESKITLESKYYIIVMGETCQCGVGKNPDRGIDWLFGIPFFIKYCIEFDFTDKDEHLYFWTKK
ncbi:Lysosomal aspartic protease-like [Oopsacas minuta]|uniref:Lysosomal aspartic protease-like n=1 Tax=Oopsacas minuta TaxID=111878 RepID=A0AAV7JC88_9METZ|nr:Lysosomal aspartic protease-like [Oopsacas minuta]